MSDTFSKHELLDRVFLAENFVAGHLLEHPALESFPDVQEQLKAVHKALFDAYQMLGGQML